MKLSQLTLFEPTNSWPEGFRYQPEFLTKDEEMDLVARFQDLSFKEFEFHGFLGKRRVVSFGWKHDFGAGRLRESEPIPEFIVPICEKAAAFATIDPQTIAHVLVTEYSAGTAIGWPLALPAAQAASARPAHTGYEYSSRAVIIVGSNGGWPRSLP
jgi:hypothetical protein